MQVTLDYNCVSTLDVKTLLCENLVYVKQVKHIYEYFETFRQNMPVCKCFDVLIHTTFLLSYMA